LRLAWEALLDVTLIILLVAAIITIVLAFVKFPEEEGARKCTLESHVVNTSTRNNRAKTFSVYKIVSVYLRA
jgi:hypothetical protein